MRLRTMLTTLVLALGGPLSADDAAKVAADAYLFGYPLVLMDVTREVGTATPKVDEKAHKAPINQFGNMREFPTPAFTDVVSPNADTLYTFAYLDLSKGPMVLSVPAMGKRYYLMQMLDAWTNVFAAPGSRTTGNEKGDFAIIGPGWSGKLAAGLKELKSPTNMVWIIGRTQTNGVADCPAVHAIQNQYKLTPLSAWGTDYTPPNDVPVAQGIDTKTAPVMQVARMDAATFFSRLNALMAANPPAEADANAMKRFAEIGVAPGKAFDLKTMDATVAQGIEKGYKDAQEGLDAAAKKPQGKNENGWDVMLNLGKYGTDYAFRAVVAMVGLGANQPDDAVYPMTRVDGKGMPLTGANRYVIRFPKGQLPPVRGFWSLTMYNTRQFFVENPINRYAIGDRDPLKFEDDGSLTLYIQHESPGKEKESNWLPAPKEGFVLFLRLYWPEKQILDGTWKPPAVERVK